MVKYVGKIHDFWSDDLVGHQFSNTYCLGDTREYHHQNFKNDSTRLLQSFDNELPAYWKRFLTELNVQDGAVSWSLVEPGKIVPIHQDRFVVLRNNFGAATEDCFRYIVMLNDWSFGQLIEFENDVIRKWSTGDTWIFDYTEYHWAVNASNFNFYSCQVSTFNKT